MWRLRSLFALLLAPAAGAQQQPPVFRADADLALVRFHVIKDGDYVDDLDPAEIQILEDGVPRRVAVFEGGRSFARRIPLELALLFDSSGSVQNAGLLNARVFDPALFRLYPEVRLSVYGFTHERRKYAPRSRDIGVLNRAAEELMASPPGITRLYEAAIRTLRDSAAGSTGTRAVAIFSDSIAPPDAEAEAIRLAREDGVALYPVILGTPPARPSIGRMLDPIEKTRRDFARLAGATGGHTFYRGAANPALLGEILDWIVRQLRSEYVAGFYPEPGRAGPRRMEVVLRDTRRGEVLGGERLLRD